jgi:cytochrome c oxidase subunit 2
MLCVSLPAAGCSDVQSVLSTHGPRAAEIAALSGVLFIGGAIILLLVVAAIWLAIRGPAAVRHMLAAERAVIAGGIVFPSVVLAALLGCNVWLMRAAGQASSNTDALPITVAGEQWWWRVTYSMASGTPVASANEIRIPVGRDVVFTLKSADVIHSFWIPSLGGKVDMIPGRETQLRVRADRPGIFRGQCAEYCGGPHALMALQVLSLPPDEFDQWLVREAGPAVESQDEVERRGQSLFLGAGCGACHAVRGTSATGAIGPDLTHVGSRRSIGADTLALTHNNLMRFIADGQTAKPGNAMPPFRIFSDAERSAVAAYLLSLR